MNEAELDECQKFLVSLVAEAKKEDLQLEKMIQSLRTSSDDNIAA